MSASVEIDRVVEAPPAVVVAAIRGMAESRDSRIAHDLRADGITSLNVIVTDDTFRVVYGIPRRGTTQAELSGRVRQEGSCTRIVGRCGPARAQMFGGIFFALLVAAAMVASRAPLMILVAPIALVVFSIFRYVSPPPEVEGQITHLALDLNRALDGVAADARARQA